MIVVDAEAGFERGFMTVTNGAAAILLLQQLLILIG
jgi:hypothetical protein